MCEVELIYKGQLGGPKTIALYLYKVFMGSSMHISSNWKCTERRGRGGKEKMKGMAPCKYFSNISLYPNASRLPGENRTLRHSRMNTVFHWKVEFNKYLKEAKILKQNKKFRVTGYRFAERKTADAIVHP